MKKLLGLLALLVVSVVLVACGGNNDSNTVRIGVVGHFQDQWYVVKDALADEDIEIELVFFNEWTIPNTALNDGDVDLNAFQTTIFLQNAINSNGYELAVVGNTFVSPQNVFNGRANIPADYTRTSLIGYVEDGFTVGIPQDAVNGGRALKVLEAAGLITVNPEVGFLGTIEDIVEFHVDIQITQVDATVLPSLLPDFDIAVINNPQAMISGLSARNQSIFREDSLNIDISTGLINVIASREGEETNPVFLRILEVYQTEAVKAVFRENFDGAFIPAW